LLRRNVQVADIGVSKERYLELKEDNNKRLQEQIAALILRQAKGQPKTSGYWTIQSHRLLTSA
jgi:hypothetical protein